MSSMFSEQDWAKVEPKLGKLTVDSVAMARRIFVEGETPSQVARERGVSRQSVTELKKRVERMLDNAPPGWVRVDVWLPPDDAEAVKKMAETRRTERAEG